MINNILKNKYGDALTALDIYETKTSIILSRIIINPENRTSGIGSSVMSDLVKYADENGQIIALTPSSDFGGNVNRLIQFYKRFGFKMNKGYNKNFEFKDTMIRYPKLPGMMEDFKPLIKNLLRENLLTKEDKDVKSVADFINFAKKILNIDDDIKVKLAYERTPDLTTTAYYNLDGFIKVYVKDRAIIDVCRSIAHELVHHKQNLDGRLIDAVKDGEDGSNIENEANAIAGVIIRKWGKLNPEIYN
jgi:tRNA(Met) C34 N-acetyltransferase TmcA